MASRDGFPITDGVRKGAYVVNDQLPGPTITPRSGDRIIVNITNCLRAGSFSIHWHGLQTRDPNAMDGAVGLTQSPIPTGESLLSNFTIGTDESARLDTTAMKRQH
jgi:FtsP/CotA-like multicopper oxidase with cupredoxin domain